MARDVTRPEIRRCLQLTAIVRNSLVAVTVRLVVVPGVFRLMAFVCPSYRLWRNSFRLGLGSSKVDRDLDYVAGSNGYSHENNDRC